MQIKKLILKNFRRFIDTTIDFSDKVLIVGRPSCGKSTIIEAMQWCLGQVEVDASKVGDLLNLNVKRVMSCNATEEISVEIIIQKNDKTFHIKRMRSVKKDGKNKLKQIQDMWDVAVRDSNGTEFVKRQLINDVIGNFSGLLIGAENSWKQNRLIMENSFNVLERCRNHMKRVIRDFAAQVATAPLGILARRKQIDTTVLEIEKHLCHIQESIKANERYKCHLQHRDMSDCDLGDIKDIEEKISTLDYEYKERLIELDRYKSELNKLDEIFVKAISLEESENNKKAKKCLCYAEEIGKIIEDKYKELILQFKGNANFEYKTLLHEFMCPELWEEYDCMCDIRKVKDIGVVAAQMIRLLQFLACGKAANNILRENEFISDVGTVLVVEIPEVLGRDRTNKILSYLEKMDEQVIFIGSEYTTNDVDKDGWNCCLGIREKNEDESEIVLL